jgi:hypothetical protein
MPQETAAGPYQVQSYSHFIPHVFEMHLIIFLTHSPITSKQYVLLSGFLNIYSVHFLFLLAFYKSGLSHSPQLERSKLLQPISLYIAVRSTFVGTVAETPAVVTEVLVVYISPFNIRE